MGIGAGAAQAGAFIPGTPKTDAADYTPRVVDDDVRQQTGVRELQQVGTTMYAGGVIRTVLDASRATTYIRHNIFSFDATTGAVTSWAPRVNGSVQAIEPSADQRFLYIGGRFGSFDGQPVNRLVKYDLVNQRVDPTFKFPIAGERVTDLQLVGGRLFVAGVFSPGIVSVDPVTGARTGYLDGVRAAGSETGWSTRVHHFSVNPARTRMVVIGSFTSIGGQLRQQAAMINLGARATVSPWTSPRWNRGCNAGRQWYTTDVDWAPGGGWFAIVTGGGPWPGTRKLCDTVTRWRAVDQGDQQPVWVNYSGGDTFHAVATTDRGVFVSGHFRWLDNPLGSNSKGPGAVNRLGIGAIDNSTGKALPWNPTKSIEGGMGGFDLYFTSLGLWVGHFEQYLGTSPTGTGRNGQELHEGLGLLPF